MKTLITIDFDDTLCFDNDITKINKPLERFIKEFSKKGYDFLIVTARNKEYDNIYAKTNINKFLEEYNLPIYDIVYTNGELKGKKLKSLSSYLHIDNDEDQISNCKKEGVRTLFVKKRKAIKNK